MDNEHRHGRIAMAELRIWNCTQLIFSENSWKLTQSIFSENSWKLIYGYLVHKKVTLTCWSSCFVYSATLVILRQVEGMWGTWKENWRDEPKIVKILSKCLGRNKFALKIDKLREVDQNLFENWWDFMKFTNWADRFNAKHHCFISLNGWEI